ncbi:hypothetical protein [Haloferula sp. A504]|uniref:hypothetical protein n=1 Tax=Haloferula sp. A504 TaxID=3373601 RepID=UPI0031C746F0|nr:hypothetical protein [Verrucomicrobiaceae bacterium E54]
MNPNNETSPDELLDTFEGRSLKKILLFTIVVHAVILLGSSVPFLFGKAFGMGTSDLSEEERVKAAVREANITLRKIADEHGIEPQELSSSIAGGIPKAPPAEPNESPATEPAAEPADDPDEPKSAIEEELKKVEEGPEVPPIPEEEEVDLFR